MYNLLRFLIRYHLLLLFVAMELFCFFLIYRNSKYHEVAYVNVANDVSGSFYQTYKSGIDYFYLRRYSDSLVAENAQLRAELLQSKFDNKIDSGSITDSAGKYAQSYTYIAAQVTMNTVNRASNIIYLNRGAKHGIHKQMGVIAHNGIVGQVVNVTENYAVAMSVLSKDFKVSAKIKKKAPIAVNTEANFGIFAERNSDIFFIHLSVYLLIILNYKCRGGHPQR